MAPREREMGDDAEELPGPNVVPLVPRYPVQTVRRMLGGVFERASQAKPSRGVPSGVAALDVLIGGFRHERVTVLGASTSWGKSSFSVMVSDVGMRAGARILLISGEDPESMYGQRLMARRSGVSAMRLRDNALEPKDLDRMAAVVEESEDEPFFLSGIGKPVEYLAAAIKNIVGAERHDLVIVDYIQAFGCSKRTQDRRNEVTHIFRTFADAIKESGASGLILSQLKRLEDNERPTVSDLKESGDVENGAEHVLLGYSVTPKAPPGAPEPQKRRYLLVAKNKDGPTVEEPLDMPFDVMTASFLEQRFQR